MIETENTRHLGNVRNEVDGDGCTLRRRQTVVKIQCKFGNEGHLRTMIHNMLWFVFQKRKKRDDTDEHGYKLEKIVLLCYGV